MAAGMKDVATLAGVAVGTVSNVLNHPDLVRPQTRARVEAAMEQLGFIPNASARQLRAGRSRCLGARPWLLPGSGLRIAGQLAEQDCLIDTAVHELGQVHALVFAVRPAFRVRHSG